MANFALKLKTGEKIVGRWACSVASRAETSAAARDRALAIVTNARMFLFAEGRLHLAEVRKSVDAAGNVTEARTGHDVVQFEAVAEDVLHVSGQHVWTSDGAIQMSVAVGTGAVDLWLRCLEDVET